MKKYRHLLHKRSFWRTVLFSSRCLFSVSWRVLLPRSVLFPRRVLLPRRASSTRAEYMSTPRRIFPSGRASLRVLPTSSGLCRGWTHSLRHQRFWRVRATRRVLVSAGEFNVGLLRPCFCGFGLALGRRGWPLCSLLLLLLWTEK